MLATVCALAVMGKVPRAGAVKTRLVPPLTSAQAATLGACFLRDTLTTAQLVAQQNGAVAFWCYAPTDAKRDELTEFAPEGWTNFLAQRGATLTERLKSAVRDIYALGYESVCLIGADSPTLPPEFLAEAVAHLAQPGGRLVIGPADDGGYYLIGLKTQHYQLFDDIAWSTGAVLAQTLARAAALKLPVVLLPAWYDVDDAADLARLSSARESSPQSLARHTRLYLQHLATPRNLP